MPELEVSHSLMGTVRPNAAAIEGWLRTRAVGALGEVWSWHSAQNPGYPYPEAAGLWLSALGPDDAVAHWLCSQVSSAGGVGRGGADYLFDTAVALNGLLTHSANGGSVGTSVLERMFDFIVGCVENRVAFRGGSPDPRWSTRWCAHLMKVAIAADRYGRLVSDPRSLMVTERVVRDFLPRIERGWFPVERAASSVYIHASCYAVEALLFLDAMGYHAAGRTLRGCADALASVQRPQGGLCAWSDSRDGAAIRADATAQAIRIWCAIDATMYAANVERAISALGALQSEGGAILYESGSADENTWASLFTWQALNWLDAGADPRCLI